MIRPLFAVSVMLPTSAAGFYQLPDDRRVPWAGAGVPGGIPNYTSVYIPSGDPYGGYSVDPALGNNSTDATSAIQTALDNAGAAASAGSPKVCLLPAGDFKTTTWITFTHSYVVLRGSGLISTGPATRISLRTVSTSSILASDVHPNYTGTDNYGSGWQALTANADRMTYDVVVGSVTGFAVGDIVTIDQGDDTYVHLGDSTYWKRNSGITGGYPISSVQRSVGQTNKIVAINSGTKTITLQDPLYRNFKTSLAANIWKVVGIKNIGVEDIGLTGATDGKGCVEFACVENAWCKNVETNGDPNAWGLGGPGNNAMMLQMANSYHCEIRRCYVHGAKDVVNGGGAYGITYPQYSSRCLMEDNIVYNEDKPIVMIVSGGGNVIGYNFVDKAILAPPGPFNFQETGIDACHTAFCHDDLIEGNWAPNIGGDSTHGNSGWPAFFRNRSRGRNSQDIENQNVCACNITGRSHYFSYVGNLLGPTGTIPNIQGFAPMYENYRTEPGHVEIGDGFGWAMFRIGRDSDPPPSAQDWDAGEAKAELLRHGNYDEFNDAIVDWIPGANRNLPPSFYLSSKPSFFGSNPWPWIEPTGATAGDREKILPAKKRFDDGTPFA